MSDIFPAALLAAAVVMGLLLILSALAVFAAKLKRLRLAPVSTAKRRQGEWKYQGQQLESRELLDAGMGNESLTLEGESITVGGVTYDNVDMKALAKAIAASGAKFFGADWCPFCTEQKEKFGEGAFDLPFIEVSNPDHTLNEVGVANNISQLPTWVFADGTRVTGVLEIEELLAYTGVTIPQGEPLYFEEIPDQTNLISGQSYHIPLDGYSPTGQPLTYTVTSSSGEVIASVMQGNKSLRIYTSRYGTMEFYLFEEEAGRATSRIITLAESGFYDGLIFHRVFSDFVLQGGDPNGNGTGGSSLPDFEDQYDPDLRHNSTGILSFAKSLDDTNNSQFFIMEGLAPHLDFQHTVFGHLTEGEKVRESISTSRTDSNDKPYWSVVMDEVSTFVDLENGILRLKIPEGASGTETITVTVSDGQGNSLSQSFNATYAPNGSTSRPFLSYVPDVTLTPGSSFTFQLSAINLDGDELFFYDETDIYLAGGQLSVLAPTGLVYSVNNSTGLMQINTSSGLAPGVYSIMVAVSNELSDDFTTTSQLDYETIRVTVANRPTLNNDIINVDEDNSVSFNPLTNDTESATTIIPSTLRMVTQPAVGEISINKSTGEMTYTPPADYYGTVSFQYVADNENGISGTAATVSIIVAPVNDEPEAYDDIFIADRDTATMLQVLKNDNKGHANEFNDSVTIELASGTTSAGGSVIVVGDQVLYSPATGFSGSDTFTYTINDEGMESTATVSVDVRDSSNFTLTVTKGLTDTDFLGYPGDRPQSDLLIGEWDSFWVEVWVSPTGTGGSDITAAGLTLNFDTSIYRANSMIIGPKFTVAGGSGVNNGSGTATLNVTSSAGGLAAGELVLLGRVRFIPVANGLDAPKVGETLTTGFDQFLTSVSNVSLTVDGVGSVSDPSIDSDVPTQLLPMIYDLNDDGRVGLSDYAMLLNSKGGNTSNFVDFDLSGDLLGSGLGYFRAAFGDTFDAGTHAYSYAFDLLASASANFIVAPLENTSLGAASLTQEDVDAITVALPPVVVAEEASSTANFVSIQIVDLAGSQLASTVGNVIYLDHNAAGWGWFVDPTPQDAAEFRIDTSSGTTRLIAAEGSEADGRIDLISVLLHELGHVAGLSHAEEGLLQSEILPGQRFLEWDQHDWDETFVVAAVDAFFDEDNS